MDTSCLAVGDIVYAYWGNDSLARCRVYKVFPNGDITVEELDLPYPDMQMLYVYHANSEHLFPTLRAVVDFVRSVLNDRRLDVRKLEEQLSLLVASHKEEE